MAKDTFTPSIIGNEKSLLAFIKTVHEYGSKYEVRAQAAAVSSLHFAALIGRCDPLNAFFNGMRPAYQTALKLFVQKHCGFYETTTNDNGDEVKRFVSWLKHTNKDGWFINKNEDDKIKAKANRDEWSINPAKYLPLKFYEMKVEGVPVAFDDRMVLKMLDNLIKRAGGEKSEASAAIKDALKAAKRDIEAVAKVA